MSYYLKRIAKISIFWGSTHWSTVPPEGLRRHTPVSPLGRELRPGPQKHSFPLQIPGYAPEPFDDNF